MLQNINNYFVKIYLSQNYVATHTKKLDPKIIKQYEKSYDFDANIKRRVNETLRSQIEER